MEIIDSNVTTSSSSISHSITRGSIIARIEQLPKNSMLVRARLLIGLATFFDGFDVIAIAATLPVLILKWNLAPWEIGFLIGSGSVGQLIGAFAFPWYAERHGRVRAIAWSSGVIGVTSIACGFAPSFTAFVVLRVIQGIGLGGEIPVAVTYINEISGARSRGRFVLMYEIVFPIGLLVSNALGAWIVPRIGWQTMYFIGGIPTVLFFVLQKLVPESPRWLADRRMMNEADSATRRFESSAREPITPRMETAGFDEMANRHPERRILDVFGPAYLRRTIVVAMLFITCGFIQYGLSSWLPTIYRVIYHAPLQLALNLAVAASALGVIGSLACALLVDRVGRKPIIGISFVLCAMSLMSAGVFHKDSVYVVAAFCALSFGFLSCGFITTYVYAPELYPTRIRAFGCGLGGAWLKIAAIFAPGIVSKTMVTGRLDIAFYVLAIVPFVAAVTVHWLGIETKGKVLEQLEV